jgi:hypothetical protein
LRKRDMLELGLSLISFINSYREKVSHVFLMRWGALTPRHTFNFQEQMECFDYYDVYTGKS